MEMLTGLIAEGIGIRHGTCDTGMSGSTTTIVCADLAGFGNDYFNTKFYMQILLNANSVGNAPELTCRQITDYVSATGTFTVTAFGANVEENDKILIIYESIALLGLHADATLAKMVDDSWLAHLMAIDGDVSAYDDNTDSQQAIRDRIDTLIGTPSADIAADIAAISALSAKEKSLLGIGIFPGFQDYFDTVANDADPDTTYWNVVENGAGTVNVENDDASKPGFLVCDPKVTNGDDAIANTFDKKVFSLKNGVTTIHLKAYVKLDGYERVDDECGIGFCKNDASVTDINFLSSATNEVAAIVVDTGAINAHSSDGTLETNDLSAFITDNTWFTLEIKITASDVKFYIDGTLRATHSTRVPDSVWQVVIGGRNIGNNEANIAYCEWIQVWGE